MQGAGSQVRLLKLGSAQLPKEALDGLRIMQIDTVAEIIGGLHKKLNCQARAAVVGLGIQSVVTRMLDIPRASDIEQRTIIEGELLHYQILRTGAGAFDYFRLETVSPNEAMPAVLVMAVEDRIAQSYRVAIEKAGLQMVALEPISLSLFRAVYPLMESEPAALCLSVTPQRSELSILDHGKIRLYRRLDMGSNDFVKGRRENSNAPVRGPVDLSADTTGTMGQTTGGLLPLDDEEEDTEKFESDSRILEPLPPLGEKRESQILPQAAAAFANEVQRSLDYYRREFPNAPIIRRIFLSTNDPEAADLNYWLTQILHMEVRVAQTPGGAGLPENLLPQVTPPQGLRWLGAAGLALHALTPDWKHVPRFNLLAGTQPILHTIERDRLAVIMAIAVGILAAGFIFGSFFRRDANIEKINAQQKRQTLGVIQNEINLTLQNIQDQQTLSRIIKSDNLPVARLVDLITGALPPTGGVGLTKIAILRDGHITIEGNGRDLQNFNLFYFDLNRCPYFESPRYQSISFDTKTGIASFRVETSLKGTQDALARRNAL
jgi:Tfp pilus assembly PilM family ATPase